MTPETKATVLAALQMMRGDDLERAEAAFKHCTPEQLQQPYGQSGYTKAEILQLYRNANVSIDAAIREVETL